MALEELGLTYLKLGQFLALRFDILPAEVCHELNNLFENVRPMSFEAAREVVESDLGQPLDELFAEFDPRPIAAASVAQVHRARSFDGESLAVKVQRRGLQPIFEADIRILGRLATLIDISGAFGKLSAKGILNEFAEWTLQELDFTIEGSTAEHLARLSKDFVIIPGIHWLLTTPKVLTMDYVEGISALQLAKLLAEGGIERVLEEVPGLDLQKSLQRFADACLHQIFVYGFFHGDPHPGNLMFRSDNCVAFLDFGIFGSLSSYEREVLAGQIENLTLGEIERSYQYYSKQLIPTEETDSDRVRREAIGVLRQWYEISKRTDSSPEERHLAKFTADMIEVARHNQVRYGLNYLLSWRALNNLSASLLLVAPDFDLLAELRVFFHRIRPRLFEQLTDLVGDDTVRARVVEASRRLPSVVDTALSSWAVGRFQVHAMSKECTYVCSARNTNAQRLAAAVLFISLAALLSKTTLPTVLVIAVTSLTVGIVLLLRRFRRQT